MNIPVNKIIMSEKLIKSKENVGSFVKQVHFLGTYPIPALQPSSCFYAHPYHTVQLQFFPVYANGILNRELTPRVDKFYKSNDCFVLFCNVCTYLVNVLFPQYFYNS